MIPRPIRACLALLLMIPLAGCPALTTATGLKSFNFADLAGVLSKAPDTIGDPDSPLRINGVRLAEDYATSGKVHVRFSLVVEDQDLTSLIEPETVEVTLPAPQALVDEAKKKRAEAALNQQVREASEQLTAARPDLAASVAQVVPDTLATAEAGASVPLPLDTVVEAEIVIGALRTVPLDVAFAIDSSGSMGNSDPSRLRVSATQAFLGLIRPGDRAAIASFTRVGRAAAPALTVLQPMTGEVSRLKTSVDGVTQKGGTPLYDAIYEALELVGPQSPDRKRAVVVLTDGVDSGSARDLDDVVEVYKETDVVLVLIAFSYFKEGLFQDLIRQTQGYFTGARGSNLLPLQLAGAARILNGDAEAILTLPPTMLTGTLADAKIAATVDGKRYETRFNLTTK